MSAAHLSVALLQPTVAPEKAGTWLEHLQGLIDNDWRPGEFDPERLLLVPDPNNPQTNLTECPRESCWVLMPKPGLCPTCRRDFRLAVDAEPDLIEEAWLAVPRQRASNEKDMRCSVEDCPRRKTALSLCRSHARLYRASAAAHGPDYTVETWKQKEGPSALPSLLPCAAPSCRYERSHKTGLCDLHSNQYRTWTRRQGLEDDQVALDTFLRSYLEPTLDAAGTTSYASRYVTAFALLPEPLRWELLYVVQQRDKAGRARLDPEDLRYSYVALRGSGIVSAVGGTDFTLTRRDKNYNGAITEWQRLLDAAYRDWSGVDDRDPRLLYMSDLVLTRSSKPVGPNAIVDLRGIHQDWLVETVRAWAQAAPRVRQSLSHLALAWTVASGVLQARGTPRQGLGPADMDAVVKALRQRWPAVKTQARAIAAIDDVVRYARRHEGLDHIWASVPTRFEVDPARHQAVGSQGRERGVDDEPFRFVPQPILDWLMDHLHLLDRGDDYLTAEARFLIFMHERCGRRPGETASLLDDCISYDDQGSPYLEWRQGKPPFGKGKRLPIHQETHDVVREWQRIKAAHGVTSKWLLPSRRFPQLDRTYAGNYLQDRIKDLVRVVTEKAPFQGSAEGADGNLVHFDMDTIDPYSFRHAFAQRLADATDAEGRSTTPPDVLQDLMGHKSFNTTMVYYEITAKRRKKALEGIPSRRISLNHGPVGFSPERAAFTKIAVTSGDCTEPQNVAAGGHLCMLEHACESCPFFLVDPLERDGIQDKRHQMRVKLERARAIDSPAHVVDHYVARIADCTRLIAGIDDYIAALPQNERDRVEAALTRMADTRRRATAPRRIDLRTILQNRST